MQLEIHADLKAVYDTVTDADLERHARGFKPPAQHESILGVIHSMEVRRLFAAASKCDRIAAEALIKQRYDSTSDEEENQLGVRAGFYSALGNWARDTAWLEAKRDGGPEVWAASAVGLREGWMMVATSANQNPLAGLLGSIRVSGAE